MFSGISPFFYLASFQLPLNYCHIRKGNSVKVNDIKVFRRNNDISFYLIFWDISYRIPAVDPMSRRTGTEYGSKKYCDY